MLRQRVTALALMLRAGLVRPQVRAPANPSQLPPLAFSRTLVSVASLHSPVAALCRPHHRPCIWL
jgi:hypothetical protein